MNLIQQINSLAGNTDLYLLDYILKEKFAGIKTVLDAGCGEGRNLTFFFKANYDIYGIDKEPLAIKMCRMRFSAVSPDHFVCGPLVEIPFEDGSMDLVISSAVLHFAPTEEEFFRMWKEHTRITGPGGLLFLRMASTWGGVRPEGFSFYLNDDVLQQMLEEGWKLAEPVKTVLVGNIRSMCAVLFERLQ